MASNESHQRHPTVHFQLPPSPISSPQKQFESHSKRCTDPKIDNESINATVVNNNNYENSRHNTQMQRKMFFMQSNPIQNTFNQNKPPSGKRSYTIINTELHTNEMWVLYCILFFFFFQHSKSQTIKITTNRTKKCKKKTQQNTNKHIKFHDEQKTVKPFQWFL